MAGTGPHQEPPVWPPRDDRPRVLVECSGDGRRDRLVAVLEGRNHAVIDCAGPKPDEGHLCPAVEGGRCPGAAHADVVVCDLDERDPSSLEVPEAVAHELRVGASVIVVVSEEVARRHEDELADCRLLCRPVTPDEVLAAVDEALEDLARTPPPRPLRPPGQQGPRPPG